MRKLFALILILGVLACALGFYAADTFETSDYYRVLNPVFRTAVKKHGSASEGVQRATADFVCFHCPLVAA